MRVPKIKVENPSLGELMYEIQQGNIRVPRFQREFVWERSRILKLFDSMYEEYPIGTIFLWNAPPEYNYLLRSIEELGQPPLSHGQHYKLILDGQQRLTSLYAVIQGLQLEGEDYSKIVVDLANDGNVSSPFKYRKPDNKRWVSVNNLLASDPFSIYNNLPDDEHRRRFSDFRSALHAYPFSIVAVSDMEVEDAIEIFERINRQGRSLSRYDLISASVLTDDFDLRERSESDIINRLKTGFGEIEESSIPQALALNKKGRTDYKTQLDLTTEDVLSVWKDTVECFGLAVDFVKNLGVIRMDFLPYNAMLPVLVNYFFRAGSRTILSGEHRKQLEYWFWRSAFSQRYTSASQTRMTEDATWIKRLIDHGTPYRLAAIAGENALVDASMTHTTSAIRSGILCLLNIKRPLHFRNRAKINIGDEHFSKFTKAEKHHIFPVGFLRKQGYETRKVHSIPNFCFIPAELNRWIADKPPSVYMGEIRSLYDDKYEFERVMRTHLIPIADDSGIWTDDYDLFLKQRARLLIEEISRRCGMTIQVEPEKRDPVVNKIEITLRDRIHCTLLANSNYWKRRIPGDVRKIVDGRIDQYLKKTPSASKQQFYNPRKKLDFCDVSDYSKIILRKDNWQLFGSVFNGDKTQCERVLDDFRDFRVALKHNREIDSMLNHRAQAAMLWLKDVLNIDLSEFGI